MATALIRSEVQDMKRTPVPVKGRYSSGYGPKIPTAYMLKVADRWRRVYIVNYGNSGNTYVIVNGENLYLESDIEYGLEEL